MDYWFLIIVTICSNIGSKISNYLSVGGIANVPPPSWSSMPVFSGLDAIQSLRFDHLTQVGPNSLLFQYFLFNWN